MIDTRIIEYLFKGNNKNIKDKANISLCLLQTSLAGFILILYFFILISFYQNDERFCDSFV